MKTFFYKVESIYCYAILALLSIFAILFANLACAGRIYEPKVPEKLKK